MNRIPVYKDHTKREILGYLHDIDFDLGYNARSIRLFGSTDGDGIEPSLGDINYTNGAAILEAGRSPDGVRKLIRPLGADWYQGAVAGGPLVWTPSGWVGGDTRETYVVRSADDPTAKPMPPGEYWCFFVTDVHISGTILTGDLEGQYEQWQFYVTVEPIPKFAHWIKRPPGDYAAYVPVGLFANSSGSTVDATARIETHTDLVVSSEIPAGQGAMTLRGAVALERVLLWDGYGVLPVYKTNWPYTVPTIEFTLSWWALKMPMSVPPYDR